MQNTTQSELVIFEKARKPEPADFAGIATDFYKRFNNRKLHIFGSGWGSQAHLNSLTKALYETSLKPTISVLELRTPEIGKVTNYRVITNTIEDIKKALSETPEIIVCWDDWANTGFSSSSTLIGVVKLKDELGFKEVYSGNTLDFCSQGNYRLFWESQEYLGPKRFLKEKFPFISDKGLTQGQQKEQQEIREKTISDLEARGYLDVISDYRYSGGLHLSELVKDYSEKPNIIERARMYLLGRKAMKKLNEHLNQGEK